MYFIYVVLISRVALTKPRGKLEVMKTELLLARDVRCCRASCNTALLLKMLPPLTTAKLNWNVIISSISVSIQLPFTEANGLIKSGKLFFKNEMRKCKNKYYLLGLNLPFLLPQNRVSEFHTELELLPQQIIQTIVFIIMNSFGTYWPVSAMDRSYNKIFRAKVNFIHL